MAVKELFVQGFLLVFVLVLVNEASGSCSNFPCGNNGTCITDSYGRYRCTCEDGYSAQNCSVACTDKNQYCYAYKRYCTDSNYRSYLMEQCMKTCTNLCPAEPPCSSNPCDNNGTCWNERYGTYYCACPSGYTGKNCSVANPCSSQPCRNGGNCSVSSWGRYYCRCPQGYSGRHCESALPCLSNPCRNGGRCHNYWGGYWCDCLQGYTGRNCETAFPCNSRPCLNNGTCVNSWYQIGRYSCYCRQGYTGKNCSVDLANPCSSQPCRNGGNCSASSWGRYYCRCPQGYSGRHCESAPPCSSNPCQNGGRCHHYWWDWSNYYCSCPQGYSGKNCDTATPCASQPCLNNGTCWITWYGGYSCHCVSGHTGKNCSVAIVNPCSRNPCRNGGSCVRYSNWYYYCRCRYGYSGRHCETGLSCNSAPCHNNGTCHSTYYGGYYCTCPHGFSGRTCETTAPKATVMCHQNYFGVYLDKVYFPNVDWSRVHLNDPSCKYFRSNGRVYFTLSSCGTVVTETYDKITFSNKVMVDNQYLQSNDSIVTRGNQVLFKFSCTYGRRQFVSTTFEPSNPTVHVSEDKIGNFTFTMKMFKSSSYKYQYQPYEMPVKVSLNQPLWVEYRVDSGQLTVFAENCRATPSSSPNAWPRYEFLKDGCVRDPTMNYKPIADQQIQQFSINSFRFVFTNSRLVYLHCELVACHRYSNGSRCQRGCISSGNRQRREVEQDEDSSKLYKLSIGPFEVPKTHSVKSKSTENQDGTQKTVVLLVGVIGGVMIVACAVIIIWYKKRLQALPSPPTVNSYENGGAHVDSDEKHEVCEMQVKT